MRTEDVGTKRANGAIAHRRFAPSPLRRSTERSRASHAERSGASGIWPDNLTGCSSTEKSNRSRRTRVRLMSKVGGDILDAGNFPIRPECLGPDRVDCGRQPAFGFAHGAGDRQLEPRVRQCDSGPSGDLVPERPVGLRDRAQLERVPHRRSLTMHSARRAGRLWEESRSPTELARNRW